MEGVSVAGRYIVMSLLQVTASDNSGRVTLTHDQPPKFNNPGIRTVNYNAKDESGNHASCTFYVKIVGELANRASKIEYKKLCEQVVSQ